MTTPPRLPAPTQPVQDARVLVLYAHPTPTKSRVNRALAQAARAVPGVTVHDLYEAAPDQLLDVPAEQALLAHHDVLVLQHPLYWYSTPPLVKAWLDHVLTWGWAYGPDGDALRGKRLLQVVTTGGPVASYRPGGLHDAKLTDLLLPMRATARLCGMTWTPPLAFHGAHALQPSDVAAAEADYVAVLEALVDGRLDPDRVTPEGCLDVTAAAGGPRG